MVCTLLTEWWPGWVGLSVWFRLQRLVTFCYGMSCTNSLLTYWLTAAINRTWTQCGWCGRLLVDWRPALPVWRPSPPCPCTWRQRTVRRQVPGRARGRVPWTPRSTAEGRWQRRSSRCYLASLSAQRHWYHRCDVVDRCPGTRCRTSLGDVLARPPTEPSQTR